VVRSPYFVVPESGVRSPSVHLFGVQGSGHGHGGAVTASSSRNSSWPMQSKAIRIRNISDDLKINMAVGPAGQSANQFICWPVGNAVNFSNCQTADYGIRTMDHGLSTTEAQSVLSCSVVCPSCFMDINLWVAIFTFDCGRPQNNDRKLSRSRRVGRHPKQFHSVVIPLPFFCWPCDICRQIRQLHSN